uniref:hypothetical protein n=1 Tax=Wolbachia endosymbiont of Aedes albopictus TaxID=167957 RepID=UPI00286E2A0C|nr:hypothetical protein [Wolbachia endosymbiont of Aedes albopictus]
MSKLILRGAEFHDNLLQNKLLGEIYKELQPEMQPQIDKRLEELRKVGESAVKRGAVIDVEMDNKTFFMEFSEDSKIEVAKVLEGTRDLGLDKGLGSNIIKMGDSEIEVRTEKGGERNYIDVSESSSVVLEFPTSVGKLNIILYHDVKNCYQVQVRVGNQEMWAELQKRGEVVGKGCLFGGMTVKEAVEKGSFPRDGKWSKEKVTEEIKAVSGSSETLSWVDRTCGGSQEAFRKR